MNLEGSMRLPSHSARLKTFTARFGLLPVMLVLLGVICALVEPKFLRVENLINVVRNASFLSIVAAGQMIVLIVGGFDISVGAVIALTSVATALSMTGMTALVGDTSWFVIAAGCLLGILPALTVGLVNGILVGVMRVPAFIATIGTMSIAIGIAAYVSGGTPVYGLPEPFTDVIGRGRILRIPLVIFVAAALMLAIGYLLQATRPGRYLYGVGGNEKAAHVSGISTVFYLVLAYLLSGLMAGITGILLTARVGSGEATLGTSFMLESIAAAIIGGVSLKGGSGRLGLVVLSALFLSVLGNGMNLVRVDSKFQPIIVGLILIVFVGVEKLRDVRRDRQ